MSDDPRSTHSRAALGGGAPALSRRHFLWRSGGGLGGIALAWMLEREARADEEDGERAEPLSSISSPISSNDGHTAGSHFTPRAKRVVQIFCCGGVSHIDTFDYKPDLARFHGKTLENKGENKGFFGRPGNVMKSPFEFKQHGDSGAWVSSLFPNLSRRVDDVAFIHSMVAKSNNHTPATFQMNSGFTMNGFPSMGAWVSYGLGTENENLPAYVVLPDPRGLPAGGSINWTAGFLPASHQGTMFRTGSTEPVVDLATPANVKPAARAASLGLLREVEERYQAENPANRELAARLRSYELAASMQVSIPEAVSVSAESEATRRLYGLDEEVTAGFGRNCLMARRLLERGVRFVQLINGGAFGSPRINWDAHESVIENHGKMAPGVDRPISALLIDLDQRGMLEDTLVIFSTEFGRGPATQGIGKPGRDHHPDAFTCFLAGGGVKRGVRHGASDEVGYFASENPVTVPDFHATILHLLGIDHERLTYYHNGIRRRLTNVEGQVITDLLA